MPGPIEAAGAVRNPTRYSALTMGARQFTGLWTQRVPYRDAAVEYLVSKFYSGSRFDSLIDGLNREISQRMSDRRRPGNASAVGANNLSTVNSFYAYKSIQNGIEVIRTIIDFASGLISDITGLFSGGTSSNIFNKSAGAGPARFLGINGTLFFANGVDSKKWLYPAPWQATTNVQPGTLIYQPATSNLYMALGGISLPIIATACTGTGVNTLIVIYVNPANVPNQFANLLGASVTFSGLTGATFLNGVTKSVVQIISSTLGILAINGVTHANYAQTPDSGGTATTGNGTTGTTVPLFDNSSFHVTQDAGQQWKCYSGSPVYPWQIAAPLNAPTVTPVNGTRFWQANTVLSLYYAVIDANGNVQVAINYTAGAGGVYKTGRTYPQWPGYVFTPPAQTIDGTIVWINRGPIGTWAGATNFGSATYPTNIILDSNQNLQMVQNGGTSGSSQPTWATTVGTSTTDNTMTWICLGPGVVVSYKTVQYAYSYHGIDGSVSNSSAAAYIQGGIFGVPQSQGLPYLTVSGPGNPNSVTDYQVDQAWIWRTPQGQATLILEDQIPVDFVNYAIAAPPTLQATFAYGDLGVPDTSSNGGGALNAFIPAPVNFSASQPPAGMTAPVYHLQRIWFIYQNNVGYTGGPSTVTGNGNTAFPPLNVIPFPCQPIKLIPVTVQNGGLLVMTTDGIWIILGTGTASNPFYATLYFSTVSVSGYNAIDVYNNSVWLMESNGKVSNVAIEYPFNPQNGYNEVGFPIGDQFAQVSTGGTNASLYNPATAYLSWCVSTSADTAMYVSDGAVGWFRMSLVNQPESGLLWSPRAAIGGGTSAVQSVETAVGKHQLLIGPATSGPILARDTTGTVWTDLVGGVATPYASYDTKGVIILCSTGQFAEVQHISAKSTAVGARPSISVLLGEIAASASRPFNVLALPQKSNDPAEAERSVSVYSDRYEVQKSGFGLLGDCILVRFDYGTQAFADELLDWAIYAAVHEELEEEVAK